MIGVHVTIIVTLCCVACRCCCRFPVSCTCEDCDGYFRFEFQNVLTNAMRLNTSLATIVEELEALPSLQQHMLRVSVTGGMPSDELCERGADVVRTIEIYGPRGNIEQVPDT